MVGDGVSHSVDGGVDSVGNHGGVDSVVGEGGGVHGVVTQHGAELGGGGHRGQEGRHADSQHLGRGCTVLFISRYGGTLDFGLNLYTQFFL